MPPAKAYGFLKHLNALALLGCLATLGHGLAQSRISSGTVIILNSSKDKLVVAADSRGVGNNGYQLVDDSQCKLAVVDHNVIFATGGSAVVWPTSTNNSSDAWRNIDVAREAGGATRRTLKGQMRIDAMAKRWTELLKTKWISYYNERPLDVTQRAKESHNFITYGIFVEASRGVVYKRFTAIAFNPSVLPPIVGATLKVETCWPCGQQTGGTLCALGQPYVAEEFCRQPELSAVGGFDPQESLAVNLVDLTKRYDHTGTVGGPTEALELSSAGKIKWLSNPNHCP